MLEKLLLKTGFKQRNLRTKINPEGKQRQRPIQPFETVWYTVAPTTGIKLDWDIYV